MKGSSNATSFPWKCKVEGEVIVSRLTRFMCNLPKKMIIYVCITV